MPSQKTCAREISLEIEFAFEPDRFRKLDPMSIAVYAVANCVVREKSLMNVCLCRQVLVKRFRKRLNKNFDFISNAAVAIQNLGF